MDQENVVDSCELITRMGLDFRGLHVESPACSQSSDVTASPFSDRQDQQMEIESFMLEDESMEEIEEPPHKRPKSNYSISDISEEEETLSIQLEDVEVKLREWKHCNI